MMISAARSSVIRDPSGTRPLSNLCRMSPSIILTFPIPVQRDRDHREVLSYYHKYIVKQLRGLVAFLEEQTKKKMDYDRLRELVDLSDRTWN